MRYFCLVLIDISEPCTINIFILLDHIIDLCIVVHVMAFQELLLNAIGYLTQDSMASNSTLQFTFSQMLDSADSRLPNIINVTEIGDVHVPVSLLVRMVLFVCNFNSYANHF